MPPPWRPLGARAAGSRAPRALLQALERAPCLNCGACARRLESARAEQLAPFRAIAEDLEFAASADARRLFSEVLTPSRRRATVGDAPPPTNWTDYLRLYASPCASSSSPDERLLADTRAMRLASSAFSYVLTLSAFLPRLLPLADADAERELALHIVGARAEATMPDYLWDELALWHPRRRAIEVTLVGDHVPVSRCVKSARGLPVLVQSVRGLYHDADLSAARPPDALVLFNPGIGHPLLRDRWRPTVCRMLASGRPLLLTAFSAADQERDAAALERLAAAEGPGRRLEFLIEPRSNPFGSLKFQVNDDGGSLALIQTNSHVMAARLSD